MKVFDNMDSKRWILSVGDYSLGYQRVSFFFMKSRSILLRENFPITSQNYQQQYQNITTDFIISVIKVLIRDLPRVYLLLNLRCF